MSIEGVLSIEGILFNEMIPHSPRVRPHSIIHTVCEQACVSVRKMLHLHFQSKCGYIRNKYLHRNQVSRKHVTMDSKYDVLQRFQETYSTRSINEHFIENYI